MVYIFDVLVLQDRVLNPLFLLGLVVIAYNVNVSDKENANGRSHVNGKKTFWLSCQSCRTTWGWTSGSQVYNESNNKKTPQTPTRPLAGVSTEVWRLLH